MKLANNKYLVWQKLLSFKPTKKLYFKNQLKFLIQRRKLYHLSSANLAVFLNVIYDVYIWKIWKL